MNTKINSQTSKKEIRDFGLTFGLFTAILFGGFFPWVFERAYPVWPWYVMVVSGGIALIAPLILKPIYRIWMVVGQVFGWINTRIILGLIFFVVFTPYSLVLKLLDKDLLSRKLDKKIKSYRIETKPKPSENMENPF